MIGYQWTVYHRHSGHGEDGIVANGITDNPNRARSLVETILAEVDNAAWGLLLRVVIEHGFRVDPVAGWPPAGEIQVCRRTADGGMRWGPLHPPVS